MEAVAFLSLDAGYHEFFQVLENLFDLQSVGGDWWEKVKVAPVWVGKSHHDKWVELEVKLEASWILIEEVDPSVEC